MSDTVKGVSYCEAILLVPKVNNLRNRQIVSSEIISLYEGSLIQDYTPHCFPVLAAAPLYTHVMCKCKYVNIRIEQ